VLDKSQPFSHYIESTLDMRKQSYSKLISIKSQAQNIECTNYFWAWDY